MIIAAARKAKAAEPNPIPAGRTQMVADFDALQQEAEALHALLSEAIRAAKSARSGPVDGEKVRRGIADAKAGWWEGADSVAERLAAGGQF